jgi:molybdopterin-guanine dinucleotide biosynthesis protein A
MHEPETTAGLVSGLVVAGGKSVRLGADKRRLRLWGEAGPTLLEHTVHLMQAHCDEVIVVLNDAAAWPDLQARVVPDVFPGGGSLGGIYSGIAAASYPYAFAVAADMPLLNPDLIQWMLKEPRDYDVLIPRLSAGQARNRLGVESLHAIYSAACREPIRRQLEAGNPQVIGFFPQVRVRIVEPEIVSRFDPQGVAFKNVNTPDELEEAQELVKRKT